MNIPEKIKAGDLKLGLGKSMTPPKVDCRVISEDLYQELVQMLDDVRSNDIQNYIDGSEKLLPLELRKRIHDFVTSNGR